VGVLVLDAAGTILRSNPMAREVLGHPAAALQGRSLRDPGLAFAPVGADGLPLPEAEGPFERAVRSAAPVRDVVLGVSGPDGTRVWLSVTANALRDDAGAVAQVLLTLTDITARQEAEAALQRSMEALRQSEQRWRTLIEAAPVGITLIDLQGRRVLVNDAFCSLSGYTHDELVGIEVGRLYAEEQREAIMAGLRTLTDVGVAEQQEYTLHTKGGERRTVLVNGTTVMGAEGQHQRLAFVIDISARRQAEEALRVSEERYRVTFEQVAVGMAHLDLDGRFLHVNDRFCQIVGYSREELLDLAFSEITHPDDLEADLAATRRILAGELTIHRMDKRYLRADGTVVWATLTGSLVRGDDGQPSYLIAQIEDIGERVQAQEALRQAIADLERANRAKSAFLAAMSHELRTPLNGVIGLASLLQRTRLDEQQGEYVSGIQASGETLLALIGDILDLTKIESGQLTLEHQPLAPRALVEGLLEMVAAQARATGLPLLAYVAPEVPATLRGDALRLRQVLLNLVGNALKFTERGAVVVRVGLAQANLKTTLRVAVHDTGIGIAREAQGHIFEAFTQADASTTRRYGGTGLGLAICKRLVEAMGGRMGVGSVPGRGSVFTFSVPLVHPQGDAAAPPSPRLALRVLLVCGPAPLRSALCDQLGDWGATVRSTVGWRAACAALTQPYDVVLVAEHDGLEVAQRLREGGLPETLPLVLLTPRAVAEGAAARFGLHAHLLLPVRAAQLYEALAGTRSQSAPWVDEPGLRPLPPPSDGAGARVLVAEDNPINRLVAVGLLQNLGYAVETAENGRQAVEAVGRERYDLVLMDVHMPELDGLAATAAIREQEEVDGRGRRVPIVALTADAQPQDVETSLEAGMDDHLNKPITTERLAAVVERWLPAGGGRA
jgi:PAS domain S-box-containing protein